MIIIAVISTLLSLFDTLKPESPATKDLLKRLDSIESSVDKNNQQILILKKDYLQKGNSDSLKKP